MRFTGSKFSEGENGPCLTRRRLLGTLATLPFIGLGGLSVRAAGSSETPQEASRERVRALLLSATTLAGKGSLEHAHEHLAELFDGRRRILLINFASLPEDRNAYASRMQRDFKRIDSRFEVESLHAVPAVEAASAVRAAEAIFVSGGNTFLLLRELYDRGIMGLVRERVFAGAPYAGSSAGSNIAGTVVGTTNDFPLVDIPTRRALDLLPGTFNPHHPEASEEALFGSRQWKIRQYATYHPQECIFGVNNGGIIRINGETLTLVGEGAEAFIQLGEQSLRANDSTGSNLSDGVASLRRAMASST